MYKRQVVRAALAWLLRIVALCLRIYAWLFALAMCASSCSFGPFRSIMLQIVFWITKYLPHTFFGFCIWETPFGGILRGDFVIIAFLLFFCDWLLVRKSYQLLYAPSDE